MLRFRIQLLIYARKATKKNWYGEENHYEEREKGLQQMCKYEIQNYVLLVFFRLFTIEISLCAVHSPSLWDPWLNGFDPL